MSALKMALLHFCRQRLQSTILVLSLAVALAGTSLLLRLHDLSENRFASLAPQVQAVVGPKSGGIDILLGALNLENKNTGVLPLHLFETLRAGADVHFEDNTVVSSKQFTKNVTPLLYIAQAHSYPVIATDGSFLNILTSPPPAFPQGAELLMGWRVAQALHSQSGDSLQVKINHSEISKSEKIFAVLPEQHSAWDYGIFVPLDTGWQWLRESGAEHPVWKDKVLSYFLLQMDSKGFLPLQSLINDRSVAQIIWVDSERQHLQDLSGSAGQLGAILVIVILCLAAFSVFGMMSLRSENLRVSIATLEAIGYSRKFILSWMGFEALLIGLASAAVAVAIELISFSTIKSMLNSTWLIPLDQTDDARWVWTLLIGAILFSIIGNMIAVFSLYRLSIHQELKSG
jgi:putative ABC transport system permease protein